MKKGTYVSRAVYTKLQMENKRLLADLKTICTGISFDSVCCRAKWSEHFRKEKEFNDLILEALKKSK